MHEDADARQSRRISKRLITALNLDAEPEESIEKNEFANQSQSLIPRFSEVYENQRLAYPLQRFRHE